ncbi:MAG TPA: hypothetical protein VG895_01270 [Patescibacteria group bacterium]|nr:hypothetical protein [Patescibacteria group bacterium]
MINHHDKAIWVVIFILTFFFIGNFIFTQVEILQLKNNLNTPVQTQTPVVYNPVQQTSSPTNSPIATSTVFPTASPKAIATAKPITQITYIPLTGGSTQNTDWTTINSSQFNFNINDYGTPQGDKLPYVIWDANLRVDNGSGETFARIYDTTHNIAVNGSEINISNTSTSTDVISGSLQFWSGNNTYVIQVKSLNGSTAFVDSGRIKVTY